MAASEELARRVVEAGRSCSLTGAVLEEWSRLGTPKQVEYLAGYLEAERASRESSKRATLLRRCALPAPKTFCFRQDRSFMGGTQNFQAWHCKFSCSARHAA